MPSLLFAAPPLPKSKIYGIMSATDAKGERLPFKSVKSQREAGRNPVEAGVGKPFLAKECMGSNRYALFSCTESSDGCSGVRSEHGTTDNL